MAGVRMGWQVALLQLSLWRWSTSVAKNGYAFGVTRWSIWAGCKLAVIRDGPFIAAEPTKMGEGHKNDEVYGVKVLKQNEMRGTFRSNSVIIFIAAFLQLERWLVTYTDSNKIIPHEQWKVKGDIGTKVPSM